MKPKPRYQIMKKATRIIIFIIAAAGVGCESSHPRMAALQGTVYFGKELSLKPVDTVYVTGTAYCALAEGVEFQEPKLMSHKLDETEEKRELYDWLNERIIQRPKEWKREDGIRFPVGVGHIQQIPIEDEGLFTFTDLEPGTYIVWFDWKYGDVRSGNPRYGNGPRNAVSIPFKVIMEEGKIVSREFRLTIFFDIIVA